MSEGVWWESLSELQHIAQAAAVLDPTIHPLVHQWLAGELPLVLACQFPVAGSLSGTAAAGTSRALSIGMEELLDGEGLPHGRHIVLQSALAACSDQIGNAWRIFTGRMLE